VFPLNLYARVRTFYAQLHARPRVQRAPGLPGALCSAEGANEDAKLGRHASRDREAVFERLEERRIRRSIRPWLFEIWI
jgi:hypothetical protein